MSENLEPKKGGISQDDRLAIDFVKENLVELSAMLHSQMTNSNEKSELDANVHDFGSIVGYPIPSDARMEVRLPTSMKEAFAKACADTGVTLNAQIRCLIIEFIRKVQSDVIEQAKLWSETGGKSGRPFRSENLDYPENLTGLVPARVDLSKVTMSDPKERKSVL